ncbi:cobalamin B12-binding domain-containing protein [Paenibacillus alkalitolerans]|uniref:cobalamin B12-binding domain-containing protein n=1 Tax=Paenibacillus alkalitolerans TaxID=2799335 RepID=UPI0018F69DCB|nr:cobalamin-dependent protein [Paenibacillus alkalitolerans]
MTLRVLIAKAGLDGHDRGAIILTRGLREQGLNAVFSGVRRTPEEIAKMAADGEFDCIGLSSHAGAHLTLFPRVVNSLRTAGWRGRLLIAGGLIPAEDVPPLLQAGIDAVFPPDIDIPAVAAYIRSAAGSSRETFIARHMTAGR